MAFHLLQQIARDEQQDVEKVYSEQYQLRVGKHHHTVLEQPYVDQRMIGATVIELKTNPVINARPMPYGIHTRGSAIEP
ncbi:hypothetical protein [Mycobacterium leprae]|uniref:Uncharacterized protein n=1 Tax=Mycobacterium leprae TaxID=1769 RepID=O33042_MYCLR|nr:hypothetical protein [Mycobacterium leprae]CAB10664.1 hypothetical protein MLCB250.70c [Mycobacterium leprae]